MAASRCLSGKGVEAEASAVVDEKCLSEVTDAITVERTTCGTVGDVANVVEVVGASAAVALGIAASTKH